MIKEVIFSGITNRPSDYESPDGQLAATVNISNDDGQLAPMFKPTELCKFATGFNVVYIHKTSTFTHYIVQYKDETSQSLTTAYYWIDENVARSETSPIPAPAPGNNSPLRHIAGLDNIDHTMISSIGITLVFVDDENVHYVVWGGTSANSAAQNYKYLGTHIPELPVSFGINLNGWAGSTVPNVKIISSLDTEDYTDSTFLPWGTDRRAVQQGTPLYSYPFEAHENLNEEESETITAAILPWLQKYISENFTSRNFFSYPFLVRYAFRLFDGSTTMQSSPVLMVPCERPLCRGYVVYDPPITPTRPESYYKSYAEIITFGGELDYKIIGNAPLANIQAIQEWSDIVKSVDIFISPQFSNIDFSGKIERYEHVKPNNSGIFIGKSSNTPLESTPSGPDNMYIKDYVLGVIGGLFPAPEGVNEFVLPTLSSNKEDYHNRIISESRFYLLSSIDIKDLGTTRTRVPIAEKRLENITSQEALIETHAESHDFIIPKCIFNYNSRMNFANVTRRYANPLIPLAYIPYQQPTQTATVTYSDSAEGVIQVPLDVDLNDTNAVADYIEMLNGATQGGVTITALEAETDGGGGSVTDDVRQGDRIRIVLYLKSESGDIVLRSDWGDYNFGYNPFMFFQHYADRAYKARIEIALRQSPSTPSGYYEFYLKPHETINGSVFFEGFNTDYSTILYPTTHLDVETVNTVRYPNKIYTSEVGNPFVFPILGINTVGTGDIIGVHSTARALSTGQFGQFPLYAFATDGVWALALSDEGLYSSVHPVTRDVCINPDSITPTDTSILFATERGIMLLSGSDSVCITEEISSLTPYDILAQGTGLPLINGAVSMLDDDSQSCLPVVPLLEYLKECRLLYDYTHQRIIVYNPAADNGENRKYGYAYVYSLKSRTWGTFYCNAHLGVNSYPDTLAMTDNNVLVSYSDISDTDVAGSLSAKVLFVTRPLKLDNPDVLKSVHTIILRGFFPPMNDDTPPTPTAGIILYGSRDMQHWHLVASSRSHQLRGVRGTPYKYFRIAVIATLHGGDTISGATVEYDLRQTNKLH